MGDVRGIDSDGAHAPAHDVVAGLDLVRRGIEMIAAACTWSLSNGEVRDAVAACTRATAGLEAARLGLIRDLDARPDAVAGAPRDRTAATFLIHALNVSPGQAHRDVAAAHAIDPDRGPLPALGAAVAAGEVSRGHLDVAVRTLSRIPAHLAVAVDESGVAGADRLDAFLTEYSRRLPPAGTDRLARHLLATLDPDGTDRYDPAAYARRGLVCAIDSTGMLVGRFQLDPASAAVVKTALDAHAAPTPGADAVDADGQPVLVADERTRPQRYADALTAIARGALQHPANADIAPAHVLVLATPEQVADAARACPPSPLQLVDAPAAEAAPAAPAAPAGLADCTAAGPIDPGTLGRLACDATLQRVLLAPTGGVLDLGRSVRTATSTQRRALAARDRGCVVPGCTAPPGMCEAHHVIWWRHGGTTELDNLALVCARHHDAVHAGVWSLAIRDGVAWARPPSWVDPQRRPIRNTVHHDADAARRLGQQLRLDLGRHPGHPGHPGHPDEPRPNDPG